MTPLIATTLEDSFGSSAIGYYLAFIALASTLCTLGLRDTRDAEMVTAVPLPAAEDRQVAPL